MITIRYARKKSGGGIAAYRVVLRSDSFGCVVEHLTTDRGGGDRWMDANADEQLHAGHVVQRALFAAVGSNAGIKERSPTHTEIDLGVLA